MKKRELEDWELDECVALKRAVDSFNAGKPRKDRISQTHLADALGINQGSVSAYLNGVNALNAKVASIIAGMIGIPVEQFSPRLAKEIATMAAATQASYQPAAGSKSDEPHGTSYTVPAVLREIAQALNDGDLTAEDGEELRRMARHLIKKNRHQQPAVAELPAHLEGIAEAAISTAERGGNPKDMLKMVEHGLKKSKPKEGPQQDGKRKARSS